MFEGVVIDRREGGSRASFTVRKISYGVGVERIFPLHSQPHREGRGDQKGRVRRARLNYLRELEGKAARIKGEKGPDADQGQKQKHCPRRAAARRRRSVASATGHAGQ